MNQTRPAPIISADVDLRDFPYMPLHVGRLRDSRLAIKVTGEEFRAAVMLWCASWHQVPAGSLPDDNEELSNLAGYGRAVREWEKVRENAMWGWILCSDGRWYHPQVTEVASDAWSKKLKERRRTKTARDALQQRRIVQQTSLLQDGEVPPQVSVTDTVTDTVTDPLKGREGKGKEGKGIPPESPPFVLPDWLPLDVWMRYEEYRAKLKYPWNDEARRIAIGRLNAYRQLGDDVRQTIEDAILHGWRGIYRSPSGRGNGRAAGKAASIDEINRQAAEAARRQVLGGGDE